MKTWQRLKAWLIRKLGGRVEKQEEPKPVYLRHERPTFLPLDRPFDPIDWERLVTLPERERVFFEWLGHRIRHLDAKANAYKLGPEGDRDRLVYMARKDEIMRSFNVGTEAAEKLVRMLNQTKKVDRFQTAQRGMNNHGG
jgi:hypothetical protein